MKSLPEAAQLLRCFLRGTSAEGSEGLQGWANLVYFPKGDCTIIERILSSEALMSGFIKVPSILPEEKIKPRTGHDVCAQQRSKKFHMTLLRSFNIVTSYMMTATAPMDF